MAKEAVAKKKKDKSNKIGFGKLLRWQSSSVSVALNTLVIGYVTVYCTDALKLNAAIVGTVFMASKLIDAVTDLLCGFIIDRTNTRWGKGRPYEIFMLFLWVATWGLFSVPESFSTAAKYVWLFIMYVLVNAVCKTFLNGNNVVYLVRAFKTKEQQTKVTAYGSFFTMAGAIIFNVFFPTAMAKVGNSPAGWSRLISMLAIPLTAFGLLRIITIPEKYNNEADTKAGGPQLKLKDIVELFRENRYFVIFVLISLICHIVSNMGVQVYYWKYIVGNVALMGVTSIFSILGLPLAFLMPRWSRKYGLKKMCVTGFIVAMFAYAAVFFAGGNLIPLVVCLMVSSIAIVPFSMMGNMFIVDLADYNEYENRPRMEGTIGAFIGLMGKIGSALGGFVLGVLMTASGYDGALDVQSGSALMMIRMLMSFVPALFYLVIILMFRAYKLDDHRDEIKAELDVRRGEAAAVPAEEAAETAEAVEEAEAAEKAGEQ